MSDLPARVEIKIDRFADRFEIKLQAAKFNLLSKGYEVSESRLESSMEFLVVGRLKAKATSDLSNVSNP